MNIKELERELNQLNVPSSWYSFNKLFREDRTCLIEEGGCWEIYFFERGQKKDIKQFSSEAEACSFLLRQMKSDLSIFRKEAPLGPDPKA